MMLTHADIVELERLVARESLAEFAKMAWPILEPATALKWGWALDAICEHLEAVTRGQIKRLLMNVPPGCMKSLLTGVIWPAWEWGPVGQATNRFLGTSYKQDLAVRDNLKCRRLIESPFYQERWPLALLSDQNTKTKFENERLGVREAMAFTSTTGGRGDRVLLDDPLSADEANSPADLEHAERTFLEALPTRVNNDQSAIVVIMQRLHERDTSGIILTKELGYDHLCLPMEFEPDRKCYTSIGFEDPRTEDGELLFPERYPREYVDELKRTLGSYASAGQLQQRPSPRGGGIFRDEWWQYYGRVPELDWVCIYVDTAQKTKEQNDFTVFEAWGKTKKGKACLLDLHRGKWEAPDLVRMAKSFYNKHKKAHGVPLRAMKVEDKVSGTGLIQTLKREGYAVLPIQRDRDKVSRAYDTAPHVEAGNVLLPQNAEWLNDFLREASQFPAAAHDDQIDPMMDAVSDMLTNEYKQPRISRL